MDEKYWYARGYYDGREIGVFSLEEYPQEDILRYAYKQGYDRGVADYCEFELDGEEPA